MQLPIGMVNGGLLTDRDWAKLFPPARTDENGEFSISGLGRDQMASVIISGERLDAERIYILAKDMELQRLPHMASYPQGYHDAFAGLNFTHAVGPAVPVSGTVTEYQSGKPIANATVFVERLFRKEGMNSEVRLRLRTRHIHTVTDNQGRYTLVGIPPGHGHVLNVTAPQSEPWLMAQQEISVEPDQRQATVNIQVFRGIWIEGQVTDQNTGKPVNGTVDYLAAQKNSNIPQTFGLQDAGKQGSFSTDKSGHYRVAGLPGPGVLFVNSYGHGRLPPWIGGRSNRGV